MWNPLFPMILCGSKKIYIEPHSHNRKHRNTHIERNYITKFLTNYQVILFFFPGNNSYFYYPGELPERSIGAVSKTVVPAMAPRVRIPDSPQTKIIAPARGIFHSGCGANLFAKAGGMKNAWHDSAAIIFVWYHHPGITESNPWLSANFFVRMAIPGIAELRFFLNSMLCILPVPIRQKITSIHLFRFGLPANSDQRLSPKYLQ